MGRDLKEGVGALWLFERRAKLMKDWKVLYLRQQCAGSIQIVKSTGLVFCQVNVTEEMRNKKVFYHNDHSWIRKKMRTRFR